MVTAHIAVSQEPTITTAAQLCNVKNMAWNSFLIFLFCLNVADCQVEIHLCANPQKNQQCEMVCTTNDFLQDIEFFLGGNSRGSCSVGLFCTNGITQTDGRNSTLPISGLTKGDEGEWKCKYGTQQSAGKTLIVKSPPSTVEILQTIPGANVSMDISQVDISATCFCIYPSTTKIDILYKSNKMSDFEVLETIPASSFTAIPNPGHSCLAYEFEIFFSNYTISIHKNAELSNKGNVYFKVQFGEFSTSEVGPFYFTAASSSSKSNSLEQNFNENAAKVMPTVICIYLVGAIIVIIVNFCVPESKVKAGCVKTSTSSNEFCIIVCPLISNPKEECCLVCSNAVKLAVAVIVFCILAVGFGVGFSFIEFITGIVLSILTGLALLAIFILSAFPHCPSKPLNGPIAKDSKGVTSDRSNGDRARSPTSASEVKVQTEKSSHSNSAEKSTDLKKPLPRPLPIPMGRNNQLEPLQKPDNGEVERSAPEKKKKKKKKRKREEASVENEEEN